MDSQTARTAAEISMPFPSPQQSSSGLNPGYINVQPQIGFNLGPHPFNPGPSYVNYQTQQPLPAPSLNNFPQLQHMALQPQRTIDRVMQNVTETANKLNEIAIAAANHAKELKFIGDPIMPLSPKVGIPAGLEHFVDLDEVLVQRGAGFLQTMTGFENSRRYYVLNGKKERMYFIGNEEDRLCDCFCCCCCYTSIPPDPSRSFQMAIVDFSGRPVIWLERPRDWALYASIYLSCTCPFLWMQTTSGKSIARLPDGTQIGEIIDKHGRDRPNFEIKDAEGRLIMRIFDQGVSDFQLLRNAINDPNYCVTLPITAENGTQIGAIKQKIWEDNIHVHFIPNLDVKWKSLILCCLFLTEFKNEERKRMSRKESNYAQ